MNDGVRELVIRGELVRLLPEGVLHWVPQRVLAVADFHLGKAETFGRNGFPLPGQAQTDDLRLLGEVIRREGVRKVVFLGDLVHARQGLTPELEEEFALALRGWNAEVLLTEGNHDRGTVRQWPKSWASVSVREEWSEGPFVFRHEPGPGGAGGPPRRTRPFAWTGHLHPCVRLSAGPDRMRMKAFLIGPNGGVLPAFSRLAGGHDVNPGSRNRVFAIADQRVFELSCLGRPTAR